MKKIFLTSLLFVLTITLSHARAKIPVCFPCEKITKVTELPNQDQFKDEHGKKLFLGYMYQEYGIIFIPAWISDGKYVLTNEAEDSYMEINPEDKKFFETELKVDMTKNPLSFWKNYGGKAIYLLIIGIIVFGMFSKNDEE